MMLTSTDLQILAVAEDRLTGFHVRPFDEISTRCGVPVEVVLERLGALLAAGKVRRIRQTLLSTSLADGALVAWRVPEERLESAWEWLRQHDPFTGHVVLRRCDNPAAPGADYRLWTTLKVPTGSNTVEGHCRLLMQHIGATAFAPLPVVGMFALGVGHVRRAGLQPGDKLDTLPPMQCPTRPQLSAQDWQVLMALKESLRPEELVREPWVARARSIGLTHEEFCAIATELDKRKVIGRFATFLNHTGTADKHSGTGAAGLFHWAVPPGMEERAGAECGRHICMTHCYWRSGGEPFGGAQIMGVVHSADWEGVLAHKAAIDSHLAASGIPVLHTAIFRSEKACINPSEIDPVRYAAWLAQTAKS
ncbi:MAG: Lrp/AsnC family transcriptional regulator [Akkermansia sp.]|nr:Lrp/AsnC family transcriptional regulator [Akkermansia sp.]